MKLVLPQNNYYIKILMRFLILGKIDYIFLNFNLGSDKDCQLWRIDFKMRDGIEKDGTQQNVALNRYIV